VERKLNIAPTVLIHPASKGWKASYSGAPTPSVDRFDTLAELAGTLPPESVVKIALPVSMVLMERMTLPALDRNELRGMVHLQLEKSLPFQVEDVTCNFLILKQTEAESSVLALAINNEQFNTFCQPLRQKGQLPQKATFFALHLGKLCPETGVSLVIYKEEGNTILSIFENRKLAFLQVLPAVSVPELMEEIPAILFRAELDGISTDFPSILLDRNLAELESPLRGVLALPVQSISTEEGIEDNDCDLLPDSFQQERHHRVQSAKLKSNLITAAIAYLMLVATGFVCLILLQYRVNKVDSQITRLKPDIDFVQSRVARWNALAPAIEKDRFVVELLFQVCSSLPSDGIRITNFETSKDQFMVEGEAPTAALAIEFGDQLKANPSLKDYHFEIGQPSLLPNEHAQMRIIGKL